MSNINDLTSLVKAFCSERDWDQFHGPKDLAIGIATEAAELLDLFRFKADTEINDKLNDPIYKKKVENEIADILFFTLRFAQMNKIDLSKALNNKISENAMKYPIATYKGSNKKYNE